MKYSCRKILMATMSAIMMISALGYSSCSKDDGDDIVISKVKLGKYESRIEVPKLKTSGTQFITHSTKIGKDSVMTYCLEYDLSKLHSRWVAFRFDGSTRGMGSGRTDAWADDPKLAKKYQIGPGTFSWGGVRGHICASYDRQYSKEANRQTFYMTNMTPMQYDFNSYYWTILEQFVQEKGRNASFADTLYVVKGGTIENGMTNGTVKSSGGKNIVIPKYYYIATLRFKAGKYDAVGFWVEHKDYGYKDGNYASRDILAKHICNVDFLEKQTGIDFFHNLPNSIEESVESEDKATLINTWL